MGLAKEINSTRWLFCIITICSYQHYDLNNYNTGLFTFGNASRNLAYTIGLSREVTKGWTYIPYGSEFSISAKLTAYSLLNGIDYATLGDKEEYKLKILPTDQKVDANGNTVRWLHRCSGNKVFNYQMQLLTISRSKEI
jgi:outer membrane protein insertion porin family